LKVTSPIPGIRTDEWSTTEYAKAALSHP
jgi:hypothetical protein